jgi:hypothetical protein
VQFVSGSLPTSTVAIQLTWSEARAALDTENMHRVPTLLLVAVLAPSVMNLTAPSSPV